eukprot:gb/GECG01008964.1/.p1 GENE.gb/GECG01008964.1/~~gb/GECG01008964.1/.p1  ORF type:complete len:203 (+),score=14.50 gb/GECG01008964.1/:1-609(+)
MSATEASHASEEASTGASSGSTNVCNTPGCGKPSKMRCPTCKKLGIPGGYFCEQECFKNYWPSHKVLHKKFKDAVKQYQNSAMMDDKTARRMRKGTFEDYEFTGPLRPGNVSTQLTVPDHIGKPDYAEDCECAFFLDTRPNACVNYIYGIFSYSRWRTCFAREHQDPYKLRGGNRHNARSWTNCTRSARSWSKSIESRSDRG